MTKHHIKLASFRFRANEVIFIGAKDLDALKAFLAEIGKTVNESLLMSVEATVEEREPKEKVQPCNTKP